jgi:aminodeoxyfutalosine synthase
VNIAGLTLGRVTVHRLPGPDMIPLLKAVVALQRDVAVIRAFAPLPRTMNPAVPTTGYDDVKRIALARLVADSVPSIQVDWSLYGPKLAQVALTVGADDVDGVSAEDDETLGRRRAPLEEIRRNILAAGQDPVERNGRFDRIPS